MEYEYPQLSLLIITSVRNQQNSTKVLSYYSMLMYSSQACFKHSNFFTVNDGGAARERHPPRMLHARHEYRSHRAGACRNSTTSFLTATTLIYAIGAGITAAAGTRLALQLILDKGFKFFSFQLPSPKAGALLFLVTTSLCQDWVIYAPAAFLGCGSHLSGSLSGIEP